MQISNFEDVWRKLEWLKRITDGGVGAGPPAARDFSSRWAIFFNFFGKNIYFNAVESHFARVQSHLKAQIFEIRKPIEKIKLFNAPFTCNLSPKQV